nr:MAG TPA: hypothetical protein [Caudoviricetes sp.]
MRNPLRGLQRAVEGLPDHLLDILRPSNPAVPDRDLNVSVRPTI